MANWSRKQEGDGLTATDLIAEVMAVRVARGEELLPSHHGWR